MLIRPAVKIDNYEALYDFYESYEPHPLAARGGHTLMAQIYPADLAFAEGAREEISTLSQAGYRFTIPSNHYTDRDQFVLGSFAKKDKALHFLMGNTSIPAKESIFNSFLPIRGLMRRGADAMGAKPTFRTEDVFADTAKQDRDPEQVALHRAASEASMAMFVAQLIKGKHEAIFNEGTRNKVNPLQIQPLKRGIVDRMQALPTNIPVATMVIGIHYPEKIQDGELIVNHRQPSVHVDVPTTERIDTLDKLNDVLHPAMQANLDAAVEMVKTKWGKQAILPEQELIGILEEAARIKQAKRAARRTT